MAQKLKKSKVRARSARAIEMEEKKNQAIAAHEAEINKKQKAKRDTLTTLFCWYSFVSSIFSIFLGFWGIFSIMAVGFGIAGLNLMKKQESGNKLDKYAAIAGIVIGVIWLIVQIYYMVVRLNAGA
ncbi:MAG: DUF4190 domain-containing protein [Erysipelotrichaceae bacterium]|nr:DUF4190 domain-containing protein [Erysipelotrichaceae bacterium]